MLANAATPQPLCQLNPIMSGQLPHLIMNMGVSVVYEENEESKSKTLFQSNPAHPSSQEGGQQYTLQNYCSGGVYNMGSQNPPKAATGNNDLSNTNNVLKHFNPVVHEVDEEEASEHYQEE